MGACGDGSEPVPDIEATVVTAVATTGGTNEHDRDQRWAFIAKEELQRIVHIGASRAEGIIAIHPIKSSADLDGVSGIGPSRLSDIVA